jgi:hypothetical protein
MISSNFNLLILNLWIGLCRGAVGLPRFFKERGYVAHYIERAFKNQDSKTVCPEIMLLSPILRHTIMVESKSGANTEADQLHRYSRVTKLDLQRKAYVPVDACEQHDCVIVGLSQHWPRLQIGIEEGDYPFPLLVADDDGLALVHNEFRVSEVNAVFTPKMHVDWSMVPMQFVPINNESEDAEIAEAVMPLVIELMHAGETRITPDQICVRMCTTWSLMGKEGQSQMKAVVRSIFVEAAREEFSEFFQFQAGEIGALRITNNPLELDTPKTALAFRQLLKAQQLMLKRFRTGQLEIGL